MKTFVVAANSNVNNFGIISQGTEIAGHRVIMHSSPECSIVNGEPRFNFDLMIDDGTINQDVAMFVPEERLFVTKREPKIKQAVALNRYAESRKLVSDAFYPLKGWSVPMPNSELHYIPEDIDIIAKMDDGARGLAQILLRAGKVSVAKFAELVSKGKNKVITEQQFKEAMLKLDPEFNPNSGSEKKPGESISLLLNPEVPIIYQELVKNVKAEYRLLTDHNSEICYVQERKLVDRGIGFKQAVGSERDNQDQDDLLSPLSIFNGDKHKASLLRLIAKEVIGPVKSIDLFITEDGKFGIFEYANQFGMVGVPYDIALKVHTDLIESYINKLA